MRHLIVVVAISLIAPVVAFGGVADDAVSEAPPDEMAMESPRAETEVNVQAAMPGEIALPWASDLLGVAEPVFETGCTAQASCIWPPPSQVSCSSPQPGTCSSSNDFCGSVTCNGVTTKCAGSCFGDARCRGFCKEITGYPDGACDLQTHCCVC